MALYAFEVNLVYNVVRAVVALTTLWSLNTAVHDQIRETIKCSVCLTTQRLPRLSVYHWHIINYYYAYGVYKQ